MNELPTTFVAEAFSQLAAISAVLGGLAFTAAAALLSASAGTNEPGALGRWAKITAGSATASAVSLVVAAITWSLSAVQIPSVPGANVDVPGYIFEVHPTASSFFFLGIGALFLSVAASGWVGSKHLGIATSAVAVLGGISLFIIANPFVGSSLTNVDISSVVEVGQRPPFSCQFREIADRGAMTTVVAFNGIKLDATDSPTTDIIPTYVPAGDYTIEIHTYDNYPRHDTHPEKHEQVYLKLFNNETSAMEIRLPTDNMMILETNASEDLEDNIDDTEQTSFVAAVGDDDLYTSLEQSVTGIQALHIGVKRDGVESSNDVKLMCVGFDPVADND